MIVKFVDKGWKAFSVEYLELREMKNKEQLVNQKNLGGVSRLVGGRCVVVFTHCDFG